MIVDDEKKDLFNKALTESFSQGYNKGYNKGYEDGLRELLSEQDEDEEETIRNLRHEIGKLKDDMTVLEGRVRKLERAFYGN